MPVEMRFPTRTDTQIAEDAARTRDQVQQLGADREGFNPNPDLYEQLRVGEAEVEGALRFDTVGRLRGGESLVVAGQFLVPESSGRDSADPDLNSRGFERRETPHQRIWAYTFNGTDEDAPTAVDDALGFLGDNAIPAARTMVSALQMVLKSTDGPAPTTVTIDQFTEEDVALTQEQGQITVAVIDTGIDKFDTRADGWLNEVERDNDGDDDNVDRLDVFPAVASGSNATPVLDFGAGHGTFAAGIVRQVDPEAKIIMYRALDTRGLGSEEAVADAMVRAAVDGAHVISLSLGMNAVDDNLPCPLLRAAVEQILALPNPPAIVASAGNDGDEERVYPAALDGVISVAALQAVEDPNNPHPGPPPDGAVWSSHGPWVRCSTVGEGIVSTFVKGAEDERFGTDVYPMNGEGESWAVWSGTSFAAPQIAALIAKTCRDLRGPTQAPVNARTVADDLFPPGNPAADGYGQRVVLLPGTRPTP